MKKLFKLITIYLIGLVTAIFLINWLVFDVQKAYISDVQDTHSMEPNFKYGDSVITFPFERPNIGDVIAFDCYVPDKCLNGAMHRLVSVDSNGCMYIEGDNQPDAWDMHDYGCLMPDEIHIKGVLHKLNSFENLLFLNF